MTKIKANQADIEDILNDPSAGATETKKGSVEIATQVEVDVGVDTLRVITPNTLKNFTGTFEPADATILKSADIGVTVQGHDATILVSADIGITVAAFVHLHAGVYEPVFAKNTGFNLNLGTSGGTVSEGNHTHTLDNLSDVVIGGSPLLTDQVLTYDGSSWINADAQAGASALNDLTDVVIGGSPLLTGHTLTYDGANWINQTPDSGVIDHLLLSNIGTNSHAQIDSHISAYTPHNNWMVCDNNTNFATSPTATGTNAITIGNNATNPANLGIVMGASASNLSGSVVAVTIGGYARSTATSTVAIGSSTHAYGIASVAIGHSANATGKYSLAVGENPDATGQYTIAIGRNAAATLTSQTSVGDGVIASSVTSDVTYSVKLGYGTTGVNKNMLHLFSKGKLELYGDEAQYVFPNYAVGSPALYPANPETGGTIYDSITKTLQVYDGAAWGDVAPVGGGSVALNDLTDVTLGSPITNEVLTYDGANWINAGTTGEANKNWLIADNGDNFANPPASTGVNAIALGDNANTNAGANAIAIGTSANTGVNEKGIAIGFEADINGGANQIVIGDRAKTTGYATSKSVIIGERCQTSATGAVCLGYRAYAFGNFGTAINKFARAQNAQDIVIGAYSNSSATAGTGHNIVIGDHSNTIDPAKYSIILGQSTTAAGDYQIVMGRDLDSTVVTTDVDYSTKIGSNVAGNVNILHLFSKGKLELYGDEAQFVFPSYAVGSPATLPANSIEGGVIYDSIANGLQVYGGSPAGWSAVGGATVLNDLTDVVIGGSPLLTGHTLTYDGSNWINQTPDSGVTDHLLLTNIGTNSHIQIDSHISAYTAHNNWLICDNNTDFATAPTAGGSNTITIGHNATNPANFGIVIGTSASNISSALISVTIGAYAKSNATSTVAIGSTAHAYGAAAVAIGHNATASAKYSVGIGENPDATGQYTVAIGRTTAATLTSQTSVGDGVVAGSVTSDVTYSVKLGYGTTGVNKNMLHLFSKGKLELYGDEAQYIFPSYAVTGSPIDLPANAIEGGVIYDSVANGLQLYNGASWSTVGGGDVATETAPGIIELATQTEVDTGTDTTRAVTPATLQKKAEETAMLMSIVFGI